MRAFASIILYVALLPGSFAFGQVISADSIAQTINNDSGSPKENYLVYGERLVQTLGQLTTVQLARVMSGTLEYGTSGNDSNDSELETGDEQSADPPTASASLNELLSLETISFGLNSSQLQPAAYEELAKIAEYLITNPDAQIEIEGHVSIDFSEAQSLSEKRADAARQYLIEAGLDPDRIATVGKGFSDPSGETGGKYGASADRRIEFTLLGDTEA